MRGLEGGGGWALRRAARSAEPYDRFLAAPLSLMSQTKCLKSDFGSTTALNSHHRRAAQSVCPSRRPGTVNYSN